MVSFFQTLGFRCSFISLLAVCFLPTAVAGPFSVSPVRIFMAPRDRATAVTITNEGDEPLVMQADLYDWKQKDNGDDNLILTEDMVMSSPIIKLAPRSRQVIRLAMLRPRPANEQLTYRLIVREIPEALSGGNNVQLQIAMAFSMPVFITPEGAKRNVVCVAQRTTADSLKVICENTGNAYAHVRNFVLNNATGEKLAATETGGYILPGIKRSFDLKRLDGKIPAGKAQLLVTQDDGQVKTFDVTVAE
jgi:fimbrial chaperone protein